jgi:hypothetical protein
MGVTQAAGCGDVDGGSSPYAGTVVFDSPDGAFHFHYLSPPWFAAELPEGVELVPGALPAGAYRWVFFVPRVGKLPTGIPQQTDVRYSLYIKPETTPAAQALAASAAALSPPPAPDKLRDVVVEPRGTVGREMSWQEAPALFHREAYLSAQNPATSYRMGFTAERDISNDAMVALMIASFEPRASSVENTP